MQVTSKLTFREYIGIDKFRNFTLFFASCSPLTRFHDCLRRHKTFCKIERTPASAQSLFRNSSTQAKQLLMKAKTRTFTYIGLYITNNSHAHQIDTLKCIRFVKFQWMARKFIPVVMYFNVEVCIVWDDTLYMYTHIMYSAS